MKLNELEALVGQSLGVSDWIEIGQDRIDAFADCTDDHQFIHVDPEAAKASPFGGTIAHGFLTLSLLVALLDTCGSKPEVKVTINYGFNKVRFISPVRSGKRVRAQFQLLALEEKRPGQWQQTLGATVEIEGETKPALTAEWVLQHVT